MWEREFEELRLGVLSRLTTISNRHGFERVGLGRWRRYRTAASFYCRHRGAPRVFVGCLIRKLQLGEIPHEVEGAEDHVDGVAVLGQRREDRVEEFRLLSVPRAVAADAQRLSER